MIEIYLIKVYALCTTDHPTSKAHSIFPENWKFIAYFLCGKTPFKNVTLQIFKFYFGKLNNKNCPYGVMLILSLFSLQ